MLRRTLDSLTRSADTAWDRLQDWRVNPNPIASIAINKRPLHLPWGGGNQWLNQIVRFLRATGYSVQFQLGPRVDCILIADPKRSSTTTFGLEDIQAHRHHYPNVVCIHRINDNDQHRDAGRDVLQAKAHALADYTIFISNWVREYYAARWFDPAKPHTVILNGADASVFHSSGGLEWTPGSPLRLVTHHWSNNWNKGFAVYQEIDRLIAAGRLPETELWVIGRWPDTIQWKAAKTFGPTTGAQLTCLLRNCHVYVTASRWEAGGMHVIEGVQCGLPLLYHLDGGGIVEVARQVGIGFHDDIHAAILTVRARYAELRQAALHHAYSGEQMCCEYQRVIEHALGLKRTRRRGVALSVTPDQ